MTETGPVQTFDDAAALPRLRPQPRGKVKAGATELGGQGAARVGRSAQRQAGPHSRIHIAAVGITPGREGLGGVVGTE
jgi:hypothetical protein